ncbi:MAG TPA: hypothetical protein VGQ73_02540 [Gemmatimonadales bacterium]|jgi:hypothetical protein|nr:hypothetical protein [Gemmatimonadales bacterium]
MSEPEYLQRLHRAQQERQEKAGKSSPSARPEGAAPAYSPQEHETLRWARELAAGTELRSIRNLAGARFAVLVRLQSASGMRFLSVEGLPTRETLKERVKPGATVGEEVLGAYEVKGGRPVTIVIEAGQVVLKMGTPRPGANPVSPEKMLRKAASQAELRAKTRANKGRER